MDKIKTYIGFAKKSRQIAFGLNMALTSKSKLVLVDGSISDDSMQKLNKFCKNIIVLDSEDYKKLQENAKVIAILDKNLANAIENEIKNI